MNLPNFMCIGAAKSGTTTMHDILKQHPDIDVPSFKEPRFFDYLEHYNNGVSWYQEMYFQHASKKIIADFTPSYLYNSEAPKRIVQSLGQDIKFLVILRNPVDRAYSHYLHSLRDHHEYLSFEEALLNERRRLKSAKQKKDYLTELRLSYITQGMYGHMIKSYLEHFPIENFFFMNFEKDFLDNREEAIKRLLEFLNIDYNVNLNIDIKSNPASREKSRSLKKIMKSSGWWRDCIKLLLPSVKLRQIIRNKIQKANIKEFHPDPLSPEFRQKTYNDYFALDIKRFNELTGQSICFEK